MFQPGFFNCQTAAHAQRSLSGCRQQADAPKPCQQKTRSQMSLLWFVFSCHALRVLRYSTQFVTRLAAPASIFRAASLSCIATSFIPVFVPLHYTTLVALLFAARHGITLPSHKSQTQVMHMPLAKPTLPYAPGSIPLHYVLHSLQ